MTRHPITDSESTPAETSGSEQNEIDRSWLDAATHRAAQIDAGEVELVLGGAVDRKARALLRAMTPTD